MRDIIVVSIGQFGCNVGNQFWKQIAQEHNINADGFSNLKQGDTSVLFEETKTNRYIPRALFFDSDRGFIIINIPILETIDNISCEEYSKLFPPDRLMSGKITASNNWAKGHYTDCCEYIDSFMDCCRKMIEKRDRLEGFQVIHSMSGGTGGGFGCLVYLKFREDFCDKIVQGECLFPNNNDCVVAPYNTILGMGYLVNNIDSVNYMDNDAVQNIVNKQINIDSQNYNQLNEKIAEMICSLSAGMRFPGQQNISLRKQMSSLIPFPRMKFFVPSLITQENGIDLMTGINEVHNRNNYFAKIENDYPIISDHIQLRGKNISTGELSEALINYKQQNNRFTNWIPDSYLIGLSDYYMNENKIQIMANLNQRGTGPYLKKITQQFKQLFKRKAFLFWYTGEGMDEMEFTEAYSNAEDIIDSYEGLFNNEADQEEY